VPFVAVTPIAHEASDGRIVVVAPATIQKLEVRRAGIPLAVRILSRARGGEQVRFTVQVSITDRTGADLEVIGKGAGREVGRMVIQDVHLLGPAAFATPAAPRIDARANAAAVAIAHGTPGRIGISAECLGTGRTASVNGERPAVAASTLKVAIMSAAFARDRGKPTRSVVYEKYREAIIDSNNDAANAILGMIGDGSQSVGARRVNDLMARLGMRHSYFDGPYRSDPRPSQKRTSAADLDRLARAVYLAAAGSGALADIGVTRHEARVLIGLMAQEVYPGLIRDNVVQPVAHKAGWLDTVQNDLAMVFGGAGGTCLVGLTTEQLSFASADAIGRQFTERVLPLLAQPRRPRTSPVIARPDPQPRTEAPPQAGTSPVVTEPASTVPGATPPGGSHVPWRWFALVAIAALAVAIALVVRRRAEMRRRQRRRAALRASRR
jgi:Beta-lactamase enzyme family